MAPFLPGPVPCNVSPMLLLPIIDRELRVTARSSRLYLARVTTGLAALGMALYLIWFARNALAGPLAGMFMLKASSYMAWALCVFGGVNRTCDTLSSEKRADTLGLLFLTHLRAHDIVLGKLLSNGINSFLLLLGVVPVLSIPVLLGGVAGNEMIRIPIALFNSLFLALSVGLLVSALVRGQRAASGISGLIIVLLTVALPLAAQAAERDWENPELARWLKVPSPLYAQEMAFTTSIGLRTNDFWKSIALQFAMGLCALIVACVLAPRTWQVHAVGEGIWARWQARFNLWTLGDAAQRIQRRARFLARNPWFWLCSRDRFAPLWPMVLMFTILGVIGWAILHYDIPAPPACALLLAGVAVLDLGMRMRVAHLGSNRLGEDRQSGALEMVLSTPLTPKEIIHGQWLAIRRVNVAAYALLLAFYGILAGAFVHATELFTDAWRLLVTFSAFALISIGDFVVTGYVAMWKGLRVPNARHAPAAVLMRVLLLPWFVWAGCIPVIEYIDPVRELFRRNEPYSFLLGALTVWAISSVTALINARRNLVRHFREAATDRFTFEQRLSWFRPRFSLDQNQSGRIKEISRRSKLKAC